jgi:hypothetical protein
MYMQAHPREDKRWLTFNQSLLAINKSKRIAEPQVGEVESICKETKGVVVEL